jgi:hypothetical protein
MDWMLAAQIAMTAANAGMTLFTLILYRRG